MTRNRALGRELLVTIEECTVCHVRYKRPFKEGDFVGARGRTCDFCGGEMRIVLIYKET